MLVRIPHDESPVLLVFGGLLSQDRIELVDVVLSDAVSRLDDGIVLEHHQRRVMLLCRTRIDLRINLKKYPPKIQLSRLGLAVVAFSSKEMLSHSF